MEDEINRILSRAESKFCDQNGGVCTPRTVGLLARRHIVAGKFHFIGKEASTRWAGGVDLSMMLEAGLLDPADETSREYERVIDPEYLDQIRAQAKEFSTKRLSHKAYLDCNSVRHSPPEHNRSLQTLAVGFKQHLQIRFGFEPTPATVKRGGAPALVLGCRRLALCLASWLRRQECDRVCSCDRDSCFTAAIRRNRGEKEAGGIGYCTVQLG